MALHIGVGLGGDGHQYDDTVMSLFSEVFCAMPLCALINRKVFIVHGGLAAEDGVKLEDIDRVDRFREPPEGGLMSDLLWADPQPMPGVSRPPPPLHPWGLSAVGAKKLSLSRRRVGVDAAVTEQAWCGPVVRPGRDQALPRGQRPQARHPIARGQNSTYQSTGRRSQSSIGDGRRGWC